MRGRWFAGLAWVLGVVVVAGVELHGVTTHWNDWGPLPPGEAIPEFTLQTLDGQRIETSALSGKVTVMTFWTTWCPSCRAELADLDAIDEAYDAGQVRFLAVNLEGAQHAGATKSMLEAFRKAENIESLPMAIDDGRAARALRIGPIPHTLVIDAAGKIRRVHLGRVRATTLQRDIERLLPPGSTAP